LDCFRHYEAVVSGAVPIVDQHKGHEGWSWRAGREDTEIFDADEKLAPHPAWPLGWVFPDDGENKTNTAFQASRTNPRAVTINGWPSTFCEDPSQTPWKRLAERVGTMGVEEIKLRRELSARWYISKMQELRGHILRELVHGSRNMESHVVPKQFATEKKVLTMERDVMEMGVFTVKDNVMHATVNDDLSIQSAIAKVVDLARDRSENVSAIIWLQVPRIILSQTLECAGSSLTIIFRGQGHTRTILDGGNAVRVLEVRSGASVRLESIVLANGRAFGYGGGVLVTGPGSMLSSGNRGLYCEVDCTAYGLAVVFTGNEVLGFGGGAMAVMDGATACLGRGVDGHGSSFEDNVAASHGGGLVVSGPVAQVSLVAPVFARNSAYRGGAASAGDQSRLYVFNLADDALLQSDVYMFQGGARFVANSAFWDGGALLAVGGSEIMVDGSPAFIDNRVSMGGSAVHASHGATVRLGGSNLSSIAHQHHACVFWGNSATHGGLFFARGGSSISVSLSSEFNTASGKALDFSVGGDLSRELGEANESGFVGLACAGAWQIETKCSGTALWVRFAA
jgi:hypothetical protein